VDEENPLVALLAVFVPFSLVSIGGGPSIFAGIQHEAVDERHWLLAREFVNLFAIARAAPGPGSMLATLVGWHVDGWAGAIVATLALFAPSSLLCYVAIRFWHRHRGKAWHFAVENGLAPVASGLILAGLLSIFRISGAGPLTYLVTFGSSALIFWQPKIHPMALLAGGAIAFLVAGRI
jgi:chromate transporter